MPQTDDNYLEKVTAFVTRRSASGLYLLLFEHPFAGIQFPAGTVEEGEAPDQAVLREVREETGLTGTRIQTLIGWRDELPPGADCVILQSTRVYSRPDFSSFDWASLPRGNAVKQLRQEGEFVQVTYREVDRYPDSSYESYVITGWVPRNSLASANRRYFFHIQFDGSTPDQWTHFADNHHFRLFWAPINFLPPIVTPQQSWLNFVQGELNYAFQ